MNCTGMMPLLADHTDEPSGLMGCSTCAEKESVCGAVRVHAPDANVPADAAPELTIPASASPPAVAAAPSMRVLHDMAMFLPLKPCCACHCTAWCASEHTPGIVT